MRPRRLLDRLDEGHVANVRFRDMRALVEAHGFDLVRVAGSHHLYAHREHPVMLNLQEVRGQAKPYQVRQFLELRQRYALGIDEDGG